MTLLVPFTMFGWIPAVLVMFLLLPPRYAVAVAFVAAWLFLPSVSYRIQGLPNYTKMSATCVGILLATVLFHGDRFSNLRLQWADFAMLVWCIVPLGSSLSNGLGAYDGISSSLDQTFTWGFPYLIGRLHFYDSSGLRLLARVLLLGGLVYVPFCLWEIKMSPQLNHFFYGFRTGAFAGTVRFGGWRPEVFMVSGLMVGMWMSATALIGVWLWSTRAVTHLAGVRIGGPVLLLVVTAVLCKSMGALVLLGIGLAVLYGTRTLRRPTLVIALALTPILYAVTRGLGVWSGDILVNAASAISEDRAASLRTRLDNENLLVGRASERLLLGWGGFGRNRVIDSETGRDLTIADGLWVIALGSRGLIGLGALMCSFALPALSFLRRVPAPLWSDPEYAGAAAVAVCLLLYACDNLFNAMVNPVFMLCAGSLAGLRACARSPKPVTAAMRAPVRSGAVWA